MAKKIAIVTGGSGGLGKEFVKLLLQKKELDEIWCVARNRDKLDAEAEEDERIRAVPLDVAHLGAVKELGERLGEEKADVRYLVNTAGYAKFGEYADVSIDVSADMISVNCGGVVLMTLAALPYMKRGAKIVNISSISSFQPLPYLNLYAASKAFVLRYTRALNAELKTRGITATAVTPGWMLTGLYDRAEIGAENTVRRFPFMTTPDRVAEKAFKDAEKGKDISVFGISSKLQHVLAKLLPSRAMIFLWLAQQGLPLPEKRLEKSAEFFAADDS